VRSAPRPPQFVPKYVATIGVDYGVKPIVSGGKEVKVNFWDLAGGEEYADIRNEFYKDAQGVRHGAKVGEGTCADMRGLSCAPQGVLVFDVNSRKSFQALPRWMEEASSMGAAGTVYVVCGNKTDVGRRVVTVEEGRAFAKEHGLAYFETNSKDGDNVDAMFDTLFDKVISGLKL